MRRVRTLGKSLGGSAFNFIEHRVHVRLFHFRFVRQNIARVVRHRGASLNLLQKFIERFFLVGQLFLRLVRVRFRGRIGLIHAALVELLGKIDIFDLERGCLLHLCQDCIE